ncbi:MAG: DUF333 domain-containing protein [Proteobacteria bacterium]|nr:DUF333 domain-containing protein [Pseudomonadota bacterium]
MPTFAQRGLAILSLAFPLAALAAPDVPHAAVNELDTRHCTQTGGQVQALRAWANTNAAPEQWVPYGGGALGCTYTADDGSRITLFNATLMSRAPTMATLAYYAKVPWDGIGFGNPAWLYCRQLGGAIQVGSNGSGGGWAAKRGDDPIALCVFADRSAIDDWGLLYHSNDIVRGMDLATVLRFADPY